MGGRWEGEKTVQQEKVKKENAEDVIKKSHYRNWRVDFCYTDKTKIIYHLIMVKRIKLVKEKSKDTK